MSDEPISTNARMKRVLALPPVIPPPKGYPVQQQAELSDLDRDLGLWLRKVGRE